MNFRTVDDVRVVGARGSPRPVGAVSCLRAVTTVWTDVHTLSEAVIVSV